MLQGLILAHVVVCFFLVLTAYISCLNDLAHFFCILKSCDYIEQSMRNYDPAIIGRDSMSGFIALTLNLAAK